MSRAFLLSAPFVRVWTLSLAAGVAGFLLFPTAPLRLAELGAPPAAAGSFLAALTFASAAAAAWTGALGDRLGRRRVLVAAAATLAVLGGLYSLPLPWPLFVALAVPHGVAWSALLTAASAEAARVVPAARRAEGLAYHGLAMNVAIAVAPALGFGLIAGGWRWLCVALVAVNLLAAVLAGRLGPDPPRSPATDGGALGRALVEWRVLGLSSALFACSFGYGGATSFVALLCRERGIRPESAFFTAFAIAVFALRPMTAPWVDRVGPRRALPWCILALGAALAWLPFSVTAVGIAGGGLLLGAGFSTLYPAFSTLVLSRVGAARRGAAFGAMLAAFDVGIGGGSLAFGPIVERWGYRVAFVGSAALALAALPLLARGARRWEQRPVPDGA